MRFALLLSALLAAGASANERPDALPPGCDTFAWDVATELAALQSPAVERVAGKDADAGVARIDPGTRYSVRLHPQADVTFAAHPDKASSSDAAMAGLLTFQVPRDGRYRVAVTTRHWIDVVDGSQPVQALRFEGRRGCPLLRKVVEFELAAGRDLVLQLDGGAAERTGVVIIAVAAGTP